MYSTFGLELHQDKTRLIRFGRFAAQNRKEQGEKRPETFNFLGFTYICGAMRSGKFTVQRQTMRKKGESAISCFRFWYVFGSLRY
jgi:hypothetical protein